MTSQLLLEGTLDVKDPKESGDRKFWKAWRRVWASFSVVYPSGRREPFLLLNLYHGSTEVLEKEIKISRDGLRLFRCRSKSRPYRTWAIASGNKMVLYFAAESEVQCQKWMQALRDGLWPTCFSFQMLTACCHEVSLIDDDNTFLSGLLGVYGRFVLTSQDVISLMHPHWGATQLQISLSNIKDVLLVREAEGPAGVFRIVLKRVESSKLKALQFFCNTAKEAIQWILSKLHTKDIHENKEAPERKVSISNKLPKIKTKTKYLDENAHFLTSNSSFPAEIVTDPSNNTVNDYENLQYLKMNTASDGDPFLGTNMDILNSTKYQENSGRTKNEQILTEKQLENDSNTVIYVNGKNRVENISQDLQTDENIYENTICGTYSSAMNSFSVTNRDSEHENEYNELSNEKHIMTDSTSKPSHNASDSPVYSTVNKYNTPKNSHSRTLEPISHLNQHSTNTEYSDKAKFISANRNVDDIKIHISSSEPKWENIETRSSSSSSITSNKIFNDKNINISHADFPSFENAIPNALCVLKSQVHGTVNKKNSNDKLLLFNDSINDYRNAYNGGNSHLLPNLPSEFLDTSIHFARSNNETTSSRYSLYEEDIEIMPWAKEGCNSLTSNDSVYEDLLDRRGTVYEEIDSSDDEYTTNLPPELPKRPENLDIPDSLRLQKLSKNIEQTLKIMEVAKSPTKEQPKFNFVKKIKDVNRIMQISPKSEYAKETFVIETKLPVYGKNNKSLKPAPVNYFPVANKKN